MDVHHHLTLDVEVDVVDQAVDGGADRPLDPVLNGHEAEAGLPRRHGVEHPLNGAERRRSACARSDWVRRASWVKVASGPK